MDQDRENERQARARRKYTKRRQQVMRQWIAIGTCFTLIVIFSIVGIVKHRGSQAKQASKEVSQQQDTQASARKENDETAGTVDKQEETEEQDTASKEETEEERLARVKAEAEAAGYPAGVIELLSKNPETVTFVEDYAEKKDIPPVSSISQSAVEGETVTVEKSGMIPKLLQWDERWGYAPYGTSIVAVSGCGPTCLSMVISGLTGDESVTPAVVAAYGNANSAVDEENNTRWVFMETAGKNWGVSMKHISADETEIARELAAGHPLVCSVSPGDFTKTGHFIILTSYDNGQVTVCDPFSTVTTEKTWTYSTIKDQIKVVWCYYL